MNGIYGINIQNSISVYSEKIIWQNRCNYQ